MTIVGEVDKRGYISLNKIKNRRERYLIEEFPDGRVTLTPARVIREPTPWDDLPPDIKNILEESYRAELNDEGYDIEITDD